MKVNPVKQFVRNNISQFKKNSTSLFYLYDKIGVYRGEYNFEPISSSIYHGVKSSISHTRIMSEDLKLEIQEFIHMNKKYINIYDKSSDLKTKALPSEITTITTILDYINDKFKTVRTISKLKNKLQKINDHNPDWICHDSFTIYEPLNEKPQYEKYIEYIKEGSISEINKKIKQTCHRGKINQIPYRYW